MKTMAVLTAAAMLLVPAAGAAAAAADATAKLRNAEGDEVGSVSFTETASGRILVKATGRDLPEGVHGFHVHETGKCDAASGFESAGGHLAGNSDHGVGSESGPHPGDLPNLYVADNGSFAYETFLTALTVEGGNWLNKPASLFDEQLFDENGAAVVVHGGADDYKSQPSGNAGDRVACGVIEKG